jgi:hypothetical protein
VLVRLKGTAASNDRSGCVCTCEHVSGTQSMAAKVTHLNRRLVISHVDS